jgi:hypothetical protein
VTHTVIAAWEHQLARIAALVASFDGQVEVRLYANRGAVRKRPTIVLNGGPQPVEPVTVATSDEGAKVPNRP